MSFVRTLVLAIVALLLSGCSTAVKKNYISKPSFGSKTGQALNPSRVLPPVAPTIANDQQGSLRTPTAPQTSANFHDASAPRVYSGKPLSRKVRKKADKAGKAAADNFSDEMHAIELDDTWSKRDNSPVIWTEAKIDGNPLRFIVDTGSEMTLFNANKLRSYGYQPVSTGNAILFPFLGGVQDESQATVRNFSIGSKVFEHRKVWAVDMPDSIPGEDIGGILGMDMLAPMEVSVSFPHAKLFFGKPMAEELERSATMYAFEEIQVQMEDMEANDGHRLWLPGRMNGKPIRFMLDTGSRTSFLSPEALLRIAGIRIKNLPEPGSSTMIRLEDDTPVDVRLAGIGVVPSDFCIERLPDLGAVSYDGVLGTEVLMKMDAILSLPRGSLFVHDPYRGVASK